MAPQSKPTQADLVAYNRQVRDQIRFGSLEMVQPIYSQTFNANIPGTVINIPPRNVGLIKRFFVKVEGTIAQAAAETLTRTPYGPNNIFSSIVYSDLSNTQRINTAGWHMGLLASVRPANRLQAFLAAYSTDNTQGIGSNYPIQLFPAAVTTATAFRHFFEIPLAYSDDDLRGAVFGAVLNGTQNLQLTINPAFVCASGADRTLSCYQSSTAANLGNLSSLTITVYQVYMDQLPQGPNGSTAFPPLDCSCIYEIKNTAMTGIVANQDFPIQYANQREFQSTCAIFDNGGTLNIGTDVNYWALAAANMVNIFKYDPYTCVAIQQRKYLGDDFPPGGYYFDFRRKPLNTLQTGNLQLILNASQVNANAALLIGWEAMAYINTIVSGASLAAS